MDETLTPPTTHHHHRRHHHQLQHRRNRHRHLPHHRHHRRQHNQFISVLYYEESCRAAFRLSSPWFFRRESLVEAFR